MSGSEDDEQDEYSEEEEELKVPTNVPEAAALLYEVASKLEMSDQFKSDVGVPQLVACADNVIEGKTSVQQAAQLAMAWMGEAMEHTSGVACGSAASAARRMSSTKVPDVLWVSSPNHWQHCEGCFRAHSSLVNGHPVWRKDGAQPRWLYSTTAGRWRITNDTADFGPGGGYLLSDTHQDSLPHQIDTWTIKGKEDPDIHVTAQLDDSVAFDDADGDTITFFALSNSRCQYAVNKVPRPPVHYVSFDLSSLSLVFPKDSLEIELSWNTLLPTLASIKGVVAQSGVCAELPNPSRLWLSGWSMMHADKNGRPAYYYNSSTGETTWDLCSKLEECLIIE